MTKFRILKVGYHLGGRLFAASDREWPEGWYLFADDDGTIEPVRVEVFAPFTNEPILPQEQDEN